ncbi:tyrosyl-DNA phosphodiesterase 1 [Coccidioides immitis RMSCC 3703]|uniref:Tyrosyl-DNA phosphodiesterase 1 n=1 Tax=Coccidioides immitis RMSCC 3703 TaxID=454286 RepID=A0A0J8U1X0_COCIT|nr:tyrosyl-DNA phosphodiesterase 1 [Coccidioides immitis RMSCC 3703]
MEQDGPSNGRSAKRLKRSHDSGWPSQHNVSCDGEGSPSLSSLSRPITPPASSRRQETTARPLPSETPRANHSEPIGIKTGFNVISSPVQLTHIRDLSEKSTYNCDTVTLQDILGDPLIKECWQFNYLFDIDFLMKQFDPDVKNLIKIRVIHGSWKKDSPNRIYIDEACARYQNVEPIIAYMPEPFGTHHSKMMILIRHDDCAQIIIHTANMIPGDWANMCQGVWRSPLLPLLPLDRDYDQSISGIIGSGRRFKRDILAYLDAYGRKKTGPLVEQLKKYDFDEVRAALIASVPSRQEIPNLDSQKKTIWGWPAVQDVLRQIPTHKQLSCEPKKPRIVIQISSIASLGQTDKWLKDTFFNALCPPSAAARFSIIFPTPDEIRRSLNGYRSGGSIHMKLQSAAQQKQFDYMRPYLCHWAGDCENNQNADIEKSVSSTVTLDTSTPNNTFVREAGRRRAAPHIKTYIRFSDAEDMRTIDWAMVTSANLSTQAWGAAINANQEVRIRSWEIGVLVWPDWVLNDPQTADRDDKMLSKAYERGEYAQMIPCFRQNAPCLSEVERLELEESSRGDDKSKAWRTLVGFRMPYNLPLKPYSSRDIPWCATATHTEPDWLGQTWEEG